ncbi:hypothetical protein EON77_19960, partial [bacterium]
MPLHDVLPRAGGHQARRGKHHVSASSNDFALSRRGFLAGSGALVFTLGALPGTTAFAAEPSAAPVAAGPWPDPDFRQLDTWIAIHPDNTATFYVGKTDGGQGTGTAFRQMMCDELELAYDHAKLVMGSTDITPDQGG